MIFEDVFHFRKVDVVEGNLGSIRLNLRENFQGVTYAQPSGEFLVRMGVHSGSLSPNSRLCGRIRTGEVLLGAFIAHDA